MCAKLNRSLVRHTRGSSALGGPVYDDSAGPWVRSGEGKCAASTIPVGTSDVWRTETASPSRATTLTWTGPRR
eukprot:7006276-Alexandrium_andersonii.AAC.1